jgi:hypothetical protein
MESLIDAIARVDFIRAQDLESETQSILSELPCFILPLQQT